MSRTKKQRLVDMGYRLVLPEDYRQVVTSGTGEEGRGGIKRVKYRI